VRVRYAVCQFPGCDQHRRHIGGFRHKQPRSDQLYRPQSG
jgi:hypothetical protein